jgi:hypothetical protein
MTTLALTQYIPDALIPALAIYLQPRGLVVQPDVRFRPRPLARLYLVRARVRMHRDAHLAVAAPAAPQAPLELTDRRLGPISAIAAQMPIGTECPQPCRPWQPAANQSEFAEGR